MQISANTLPQSNYPNFPEFKKIDLSKVDATYNYKLKGDYDE